MLDLVEVERLVNRAELAPDRAAAPALVELLDGHRGGS
jgi:hypothetical protein